MRQIIITFPLTKPVHHCPMILWCVADLNIGQLLFKANFSTPIQQTLTLLVNTASILTAE